MILSLLLASALLVAMTVAAVVTSLRRRTALRRLADARGWRWAARDDEACAGLTGPVFRPASGRRAQNVLRGTHRDLPFVAFDCSWLRWSSDGQGRQRSTLGRAAVCVLTVGGEQPAVPKRVRWVGRRRLHVRSGNGQVWCWHPGLLTADTVEAQLDAVHGLLCGSGAAGTLAG